MTDDLNKLTTEELGHLFPIIIVDHKPEWEKMYLSEKQNILKTLGTDNILRIEHIGSTAVPGLCAKPTIDILIEISANTDCDSIIKNLQKIQYQYIPRPDNPPPHIMLAKGYSGSGFVGDTYHIHIRYIGDCDEIVFRNYLINNPIIAQEYAKLKLKLSIKFPNNREKYTESKTDFITRITKTAREELKR